MRSWSVLVPVVVVLAASACKEQPAPASPPAPPAPMPTPARADAGPAAPTPPALTPGPVPVAVTMPGPDDVRAARALRCSTKKQGSGCTAADGVVVIPFDHEDAVEFKRSGLALVKRAGETWTYVDARNQTVFEAFLFDNGPDELHDGRARVVKDGKTGFVDDEWRLVIAPRFDAAFGFDGGKARVCVGCDPRIWSAEAPPAASARPGREFWIDRDGNQVPGPTP